MTTGYDKWQSRLADEFLKPHDGPTVFFVDDSVLANLAPEASQASHDLALSVTARLHTAGGKSMFAPITAEYKRWEQGTRSQAPPVLPVISISVLAATRMRSGANTRSTNYYLRLAEILSPEGDSREIEKTRRSLRESGAFLDVVDMWRGLHHWIESQGGAIGFSTIREHPRLQRIGYPLSQALIRQSDRVKLTRFFHDFDFPVGNPPGPEALLGALHIWTTAERNRLSEAFMNGLDDPDLRALLTHVVEAHAQAWDGQVLTAEGHPRIAIRIGLDLETWATNLLFPVPPGGPAQLTLTIPDQTEPLELTALDGYNYYAYEDTSLRVPHAAVNGLKLVGATFTAEYAPSPVIFFRPDPQTGTWSSADGIAPFEEHIVAVHSGEKDRFEEFLNEAANIGWRRVRQRKAALIENYALYQDVRFDDGDKLAKALARMPSLRRVGVAPVIAPRARLTRGLPLASNLSTNHYMRGGEPDLLLPSGTQPHRVTVTFDGVGQVLCANGFPLELRRFASRSGLHRITVDGQELSFTTLEEDPNPEPPVGMGRLGWTDKLQICEDREQIALVGARTREGRAEATVLGRRGRDESYILHEDGAAQKIAEPQVPKFIQTLTTKIHSPYFELEVSESARYLAQRRGQRWRLIEIGGDEPGEYESAFDVPGAWKRACASENGYRLWRYQLQIATGD